jgi:hypothetical protein
MSSNFFSYIIKKIFDFSNSPFDISNNNIVQGYLFNCFFNKKLYNQNKFDFYIDTLKNKLMTDVMKNDFINNFIKIQKIYHNFNKLAFLYKHKKSKIIVDTDLCLNKLDKNHYLTFCLYQDNKNYLFNINELVKLIVTALINSPLFFSEPLVSKNPYNNSPFNKSTLYNIYFTLQRNNIKIHELFYKFFLENFDLTSFRKYNEHTIREYAIDNYIKNSTDDFVYNVILSMLIEYNKLVHKKDRYKFCFNFPKDKIILAMKPFLRLYYRSKFSLITTIKNNSHKYLIASLIKFKKLNNCFGRKMYKVESYYINFVKKNKLVSFYYDTFNKINLNITNFLNSHLLCDDDNVDIILNSTLMFHNENFQYIETQHYNDIYYPIQDSDDNENNQTSSNEDSNEDEEDIHTNQEDDIDDEDIDINEEEDIDEEDIDEEDVENEQDEYFYDEEDNNSIS